MAKKSPFSRAHYASGGRTEKWDKAIKSGYYAWDDTRPEAKAARAKFHGAMNAKIGEAVKKANPLKEEDEG